VPTLARLQPIHGCVGVMSNEVRDRFVVVTGSKISSAVDGMEPGESDGRRVPTSRMIAACSKMSAASASSSGPHPDDRARTPKERAQRTHRRWPGEVTQREGVLA